MRPDRSVERAGWPIVEVVDPRDEPPGTGLLTGPLATALHHAVDRGGRAVCVLNRRGRARLLACAACNELARCERCGAFVEETDDGHAAVRPLRARAPGDLPALPRDPAEGLCASGSPGCATTWPRSSRACDVVEVDASTDRARRRPGLRRHRSGAAPAAARVRRCCLAAFLDFDQELLAPRYRAAEQALALLARAARRRRAARAAAGACSSRPGCPDHEVLEAARRADPTLVAAAERPRREELGYPPFGALAEVKGEAAAVHGAVRRARARARGHRRVRPDRVGRPGCRRCCGADDTDALATRSPRPRPAARAEGRLRIAVDPLAGLTSDRPRLARRT